MARFGGGLPAKAFLVGVVVNVPTKVCESGKARIVGVEWGPNQARVRADFSGWLYWLVEVELRANENAKPLPIEYVSKGGPAWAAGESEIVSWAKG